MVQVLKIFCVFQGVSGEEPFNGERIEDYGTGNQERWQTGLVGAESEKGRMGLDEWRPTSIKMGLFFRKL